MKLKVSAKLDSGFAPMALVCRRMRMATESEGSFRDI